MLPASHPETIARDRAHRRRDNPGCPAHTDQNQPCTCKPGNRDLANLWLGRARMALARRNAGRPLDDLDIEAITRFEKESM